MTTYYTMLRGTISQRERGPLMQCTKSETQTPRQRTSRFSLEYEWRGDIWWFLGEYIWNCSLSAHFLFLKRFELTKSVRCVSLVGYGEKDLKIGNPMWWFLVIRRGTRVSARTTVRSFFSACLVKFIPKCRKRESEAVVGEAIQTEQCGLYKEHSTTGQPFTLHQP